MEINKKRLMKNLFSLAQIGMNEVGGIDRWFGSDTDIEARKWIVSYWEKNIPNAYVSVDAGGNLWARVEGKENVPPIVIGSHHDAVPCGGKYDGALGVLMATEVMQTLQEHKISLKHPLCLVSFTGEEPNPFNVSTLGSKIISGRLTEVDLEKCMNRNNGQSMETAISNVGGDIHAVKKLSDKDIAAFVECHIEQGHRLEDRQSSVSSVSAITGIYREVITFHGEANHAGTTVIGDRKDAFLACADFALQMEKELKNYPDGSLVGTIGHIKLLPNEVNIIPEMVEIIIDIRTCDRCKLENIIKKMDQLQRNIMKERDVPIERKVNLDQPCMKMDSVINAAILESIAEIGEEAIALESMAGHDAANVARFTKSGMIFVMSVSGKSHCKEEYTPEEDIKKAGDVMLKTVQKLDERI